MIEGLPPTADFFLARAAAARDGFSATYAARLVSVRRITGESGI